MTIEFFISTLMYDESKTDYIIKKADDHSKKWIHILPVAKVYQHGYFLCLDRSCDLPVNLQQYISPCEFLQT